MHGTGRTISSVAYLRGPAGALLLLACGAAAPATAGRGPALVKEYATLADTLRADWQAIEERWEHSRARLPANAEASDAAPLLARLALDGAVAGQPLLLFLGYNGEALSGIAHARGRNRAIHLAHVSRWRRQAGRASLDLAVTFRPDGTELFSTNTVIAFFVVELTGSGARCTGTYSTSGAEGIAKGRGEAEGVWLRTFGESLPDLPPPPGLAADSLPDLYAAASWDGFRAGALYALLRAGALAQARHCAPRTALEAAPCRVPVTEVYRRRKTGSVSAQGKKQSGNSGPPSLDDMDLGLEDGLDDVAPESIPAAPLPDTSPYAEDRLATLRSLAVAVSRIRRRCEDAAAARQSPQRNGELRDTRFGPWYGLVPLSGDPGRLADTEPADPQRWAVIDNWHSAGPFAAPTNGARWAAWPEWIGVRDAHYIACTFGADGGAEFRTVASGPAARGQDIGGLACTAEATQCHYATTELHAGEAMQVWLAFHAGREGFLWIDGRPVGRGTPEAPRGDWDRAALYRVSLREGINVLTVRAAGDRVHDSAWVRICAAGAPSAEPRPDPSRDPAARDLLHEARSRVRGFRLDGNACYPEARPVVAWDIERGLNVLWRKAFDHYSKAQPIVVGDLVVTQEDPHFLIGLDKLTGRELWRAEADVCEVIGGEALERSRELHAAYKAARSPERPAHKAWLSWRAHLLKAAGIKSYVWDGAPATGAWLGLSFATPVSDGNLVWVHYATGATACFDLQGNRRWLTRTEEAEVPGTAVCSSPVLTGRVADGTGRLVLQVAVDKVGRSGVLAPQRCVAFDASSGKAAWTAPAYVGEAASTPVVLTLTDGEQDAEVVVTGGGTILRALDGKVLVERFPGWCSSLGPTRHDAQVFRYGWSHGIGTCMEVVMLAPAVCGARQLWRRPPMRCASSWVYRDGLLYGMGGSQGGGWYAILDAGTGIPVERRVNAGPCALGVWDMPGGTDSYVPTAIAGEYVFLSTRGDRKREFPWSQTTVVQLGRQGRYVAHNRMPQPLQSPPTFDGDRAYWRTEHDLFCIAHTGEAGRDYEARHIVETLLMDLGDAPPPERNALTVAPLCHEVRGRADRPYHPLTDLRDWRLLGPLPATDRDALRAAMDAVVQRGEPRVPATVSVAGRDVPTVDLTKAADLRAVWRGKRGAIRSAGETGAWRGKTCGLLKTLTVGKDRTARARLSATPAEIRINGQPLANGDRLRLTRGQYIVTALLGAAAQPEPPVPLFVQLLWSEDQQEEIRIWRDAVRRARPAFERTVAAEPNGTLGRRARRCLDALAPGK